MPGGGMSPSRGAAGERLPRREIRNLLHLLVASCSRLSLLMLAELPNIRREGWLSLARTTMTLARSHTQCSAATDAESGRSTRFTWHQDGP